ncbi:MAG TPA: hypothetical protein VMY78_08185 [Solirubrobacteraceae bacterium]|nr:hypothetical protein [Solirubrobacteraceae bacterium]
MSAQPPAPGQPLIPDPGTIHCPRCSSPIGTDQDWCLECGAPARTRLAQTPNWRLPTVAIGAIVAIAGALLAFAFVKLTSDDDDPIPAATTATAIQSAPPVATTPVTTPPTVAVTPTPSTTTTTTPSRRSPTTATPAATTPATGSPPKVITATTAQGVVTITTGR